jgi:hypothetical protein
MGKRVSISVSGGLWFVAWLFTVGYAKLGFWSGVLAILIWPYFLGDALAR